MHCLQNHHPRAPTSDANSTNRELGEASLNLSSLEPVRLNRNHHDQAGDDKHRCNQSDDEDASSRRREPAPHDPVLTLEIAMEADEENDNGDGEKSGAERLADTP